MVRAAEAKKKRRPGKKTVKKSIRPTPRLRKKPRLKQKIKSRPKPRRKMLAKKPLSKKEARELELIEERIQKKRAAFKESEIKRFALLTAKKMNIGLDLISQAIKRQTKSKRTARMGGRFTLDQLVMTALNASPPIKSRTPEEKRIVNMAAVVKKMERVPTLKKAPDRVKIAAAELGIMLDKAIEKGKRTKLLDDKGWAEKKVV
jgi:hypothetical protein